MAEYNGKERRADYHELKFQMELQRNERNEINKRLENLEKLGEQFETLKNDIRWIRRIAQAIGAIILYLFGDTIKKNIGL